MSDVADDVTNDEDPRRINASRASAGSDYASPHVGEALRPELEY